MKIDKVYVLCNKLDFYFAKICIASIRYWNKNIPVHIIKDLSKGDFHTTNIARSLNVTIEEPIIQNLTYYSKLYPLIENKHHERILILDSDIVWMCDIIKMLEEYEEDIIIDGYKPENLQEEIAKWYFHEPAFSLNFKEYIYPGFLFNVGQLLCNTSIFSKEDFTSLLNWEEFPSHKIENAFFYEQGMLNYLVAKKINSREINYRLINFQVWGWDQKVRSLNTKDLKKRIPNPFLIHWYGIKNGLIRFLPGNKILSFYESYYYSLMKNGKFFLYQQKLKRSILHLPALMYETGKFIYLFLKPKD